MSSSEGIPYRDIEERKARRFHDVKAGQWNWLLIWLFMAASALFIHWSLTGPFLLIAGFGAWRYEDGTGYSIVWSNLHSLRMSLRRGSVFNNPPLADGQPPKRRRRQRKPPIGLGLYGFPIFDRNGHNGRMLGTIHDPKRHCDTATVTAKGWRGAALDRRQRFYAEDEIIAVLGEVAAETEQSLSINLTYSSRPLNIQPYLNSQVERLHTSVLLPEEDDEVSKGLADYKAEKNAILSRQGADVTRTIGITVPRPSQWPKNPDELTMRQLKRAPIVRLAQTLENGLRRQGANGVETLDLAGMRTFARKSWDLADIAAYYKRIADREAVQNGELERVGPENLEEEDEHWPKEDISAGSKYLLLDGTYHEVLRVARFRRQRVLPGDFQPLYFSNGLPPSKVGLTISLSGDIISSHREAGWQTKGIVWGRALRATRFGGSEMYFTIDERKKQQALVRRQDQLLLGGAYGLLYNIFLVVSAMDPNDLEEAEDEIYKHARGLGIVVRPVKGKARQVRAFYSAVLGANLM